VADARIPLKGADVLALLAVAALAAFAGAAFHRVFEPRALLVPVAVASVAPVLLAVGLAVAWRSRSRSRRSGTGARGRATSPSPAPPLLLSVALSLVAWLLVALAVLWKTPVPGPAALRAVDDGLVNGWARILATTLPVRGTADLLVLPHLLVWLVAAAGAEAVLRTRNRAALWSALPALGAFAVALLLGVGGPGSNAAVAAGMVAAWLLLALARADAGSRRAAAGLLLGATVTVAALAGGPRLPFAHARQPFDVRAYRQTPLDPRAGINPLDEVAGWLQNPKRQFFQVHASTPANWRLLVLDRFDGQTWSSSARFTPVGAQVPAVAGTAAAQAATQTQVEQDVTIQTLPGVWLPAADRPSSLTGPPAQADPSGGMLASGVPLRRGLTYRVVSQVPHYDTTQLQQAAPAADAAARADLALPAGLPPVLANAARQASTGSSFPFQEAVALGRYLRASGAFDPAAPSGHSYGHLAFFLTTSHRGTSEQFATAFAVMARTLGLPSRVVVGFRPGTDLGNGTWQVRAGDVVVWPELDFQGLGWVPFYPTPARASAANVKQSLPIGESPASAAVEQHIMSVPPTPAKPVTPKPSKAGHGGKAGRGGKRGGGLGGLGGGAGTWTPARIAATAVIGLLGLALSYVVVMLGLMRWRRRRRQRGAPAARILGAWEEALERLGDGGVATAPTQTVGEVRQTVATTLGDPGDRHLEPLGVLVDEALFAPSRPDPGAAAAAWAHCDALTTAVRRATPPAQRLRHRLAPHRRTPVSAKARAGAR